ncbi:MAG: hypothetical protein KGO50_14230 [Myxococcales bacterium]|nr:hypothetical protein [Myxococcales bacterium]
MLALPKKLRPAVSVGKTVPAPIKGWNARDPLAAMEADEAVLLRNWWPTPTSVDVRRGAVNHVTGMTGTPKTLMSYSTPAGTKKLFAATNNAIYDVSSAGTVGTAETTSTITSDEWQHVNVTTSGGSYLYAVNGADKPLLYDGSTWIRVDGSSSPNITGVTTTNLIHVTLWKNRVWFVEKNTLKAWYLPTGAVGGAAAAIDLSTQCRLGGSLMAIGSWTIDAGDGVDDYLVFVTTEGELLVYQGTDPASAATFAIRGRWDIGRPIGRRCFTKFAGDLLLICQDGVLPLSRALQSSRVNPRVALTDRIQLAMTEAATLYSANFGWQLQLYPDANMLLLNVPISTTQSEQYAMNTITGAWCEFDGWHAACWEYHNGEVYFATNTKVVKAWSGLSDMSTNISADCQSAFNYFDSRRQKRFTMARPIVASTGTPPLSIGINVDFQDSAPLGVVTANASTASVWDTGTWDSAVWGGGQQIYRSWQGLRGVGFTASTRLKYEGTGYEVSWISTDYVFEQGGIL